MKTNLMIAFLMLVVGCGGTAGVDPIGSVGQPPPVATSDSAVEGDAAPPEADAGTEQGDAAKADSAPAADAGKADATPPGTDAGKETLAECTARICGERVAECGKVTTTQCGGHDIDCGTCSPSYEKCGDNGLVNKCGHTCNPGAGTSSTCNGSGVVNPVAYDPACNFPGADGNGTGCVVVPSGYWCCAQ